MTYIAKPQLHHPTLNANKVGYTRRDYEGKVSTLCAGCGHDSISAAIIQACWELDIQPHQVAKLSGIGCSSKTPTYFLGQSHGFNTVHGRMRTALEELETLSNEDETYLHYGLFKELDTLDDTEAAWESLMDGAQARRSVTHHDVARENAAFDALIAAMPRGYLDECGDVPTDVTPIFVVGMAISTAAVRVARTGVRLWR